MLALRPLEAQCLRELAKYLREQAKKGELALGEDEDELLESFEYALRED